MFLSYNDKDEESEEAEEASEDEILSSDEEVEGSNMDQGSGDKQVEEEHYKCHLPLKKREINQRNFCYESEPF